MSTRRRWTLTRVAPAALVAILALGGCSADYWPDFSATATPSPGISGTPDPNVDIAVPPAVSEAQLQRILDRVSAQAAAADEARDRAAAELRFTGPALAARASDYAIKNAIAEAPMPQTIATTPEYELPQSTDTWPRVVFVVVHDDADPAAPPQGLMLRQDSPHDDYLVEYAISLTSGATLPEVAPPYIGAPRLAPDFKALVLPPEDVADAYAAILTDGENAPMYDLFDPEGDTLREQVGPAWKQSQRDAPAAAGQAASIEFTSAPGTGEPIALATVDGGALVTVSMRETETSKPTAERSVIRFGGEAAALAGRDSSETGLFQTWEYQLLFYVPALGSDDRIELLGYTENLVEAGETS